MSRVRRRWAEWTDEGPAHQDNAVHWPIKASDHLSTDHTPEDGWTQAYPGDRTRHVPERKAWVSP